MGDGIDEAADGIARWNTEAAAFDGPPDHGLLDPDVRSAWRALLLERLPAPPARILDVGCGTGTLAVLLAQEGFRVDGVDFSPEMIQLAEKKAAGVRGVTLMVADAFDPPVHAGTYDVVLCRHVLWAMPDPAIALRNWIRLLVPQGVLVLIEGRWSNDVGLSTEQTVTLLLATSRTAELTRLQDAVYWGRSITDDRYLVTSRPPQPDQ